jgi:hypothetical protein
MLAADAMLTQKLRIIATANRDPANPEYQHFCVSFATTLCRIETRGKFHFGKFSQEARPNGLGDQAEWLRQHGGSAEFPGARINFASVPGPRSPSKGEFQ